MAKGKHLIPKWLRHDFTSPRKNISECRIWCGTGKDPRNACDERHQRKALAFRYTSTLLHLLHAALQEHKATITLYMSALAASGWCLRDTNEYFANKKFRG